MKRLSITGIATAISLAAIPIAISFQLVISPLPSCIQLENVSKKCKRTCCFSFFCTHISFLTNTLMRYLDHVTLMQTLLSSIPKREYAIQDVNLSIGHSSFSNLNETHDDLGLVILEGRSASGKSTILRLLAGIESPNKGRMLINGQHMSVSGESRRTVTSWMKVGCPLTAPQPVILEGKPHFDNSKTVFERIVQMGRDATQNH